MEVFKIFAKGEIARGRNRKKHRSFRQSGKKANRGFKRGNNFWKMQENVGNLGERKKPCGGKQTRLAKMDGLELKGDFEQRRAGRNPPGNKAACFECGHTDHFKA